MRNPKLQATPPGGGGDVHQAARVVRGDDGAAGLGDRVELPLRQPIRHAGPLEAERAAEPAAVGDVRKVHNLVAGDVQELPGFALESELAERLAGVVVSNLETHLIGAHELRTACEKLERESRRIAEPRPEWLVRRATPARRRHRELPKSRRGPGYDQTPGNSKAFGQS